jgi:hypothetical protein
MAIRIVKNRTVDRYQVFSNSGSLFENNPEHRDETGFAQVHDSSGVPISHEEPASGLTGAGLGCGPGDSSDDHRGSRGDGWGSGRD